MKQTILPQVRSELQRQVDPEYKKFNEKLLPGTGATIGVRVPVVRSMAKRLAKEDFRLFFQEIEAERGQPLFAEERMLQGMLIGLADMPLSERFAHLDCFVPEISSWAVCDCGISGWRFMKKEPEACFAYVCKWLGSRREYELRFAVVALMQYFICGQYIDRILSVYAQIRQEDYYVKMAVAWAISVCYVKFPAKTEALLAKKEAEGGLSDWVQNKSIQKIRESGRVTPEDKAYLLKYKREACRCPLN